jgi:hypothetical protein
METADEEAPLFHTEYVMEHCGCEKCEQWWLMMLAFYEAIVPEEYEKQ